MKSHGVLTLKEEIHPSSLSLHSLPLRCFTTSRLLRCPKLFLAYRLAIMTYALVTLAFSFRGFAYSIPPHRPWPVWLTNWSYLLSSVHFVLSFSILLSSQLHHARTTKDQHCTKSAKSERRCSKTDKILVITKARLPLPHRLDWLIFNVSCTVSSLVSLVYFVALYPLKQLDFIPPGDLITHLFNSLIMLLDLLLCDLPIRLSHLVYAMLFCFSYLLFSVVYWLQDPPNNYLYKGILDWNQPQKTLTVGALLSLVVLPILHASIFLISTTKSLIYSKLLPPLNRTTRPST